jgi:hypothetical protein
MEEPVIFYTMRLFRENGFDLNVMYRVFMDQYAPKLNSPYNF